MTKKIQEARTIFDSDIVTQVVTIVSLTDSDSAYSHFNALSMWEYVDCLEFIYF